VSFTFAPPGPFVGPAGAVNTNPNICNTGTAVQQVIGWRFSSTSSVWNNYGQVGAGFTTAGGGPSTYQQLVAVPPAPDQVLPVGGCETGYQYGFNFLN